MKASSMKDGSSRGEVVANPVKTGDGNGEIGRPALVPADLAPIYGKGSEHARTDAGGFHGW